MAKKTQKVNNNCTVKETLPLHFLTSLQGDLKELSDENYNKLKKSILKHGIFVPFFIWENPEDAQIYMIDGHMRALTLNRMKDEGFDVPQLPVVFVDAKDMKDAKEKLLSVTSQYGSFNALGFKDFVFDLDMGEIAEFSALPSFEGFSTILESESDLPPQETTTVSSHERAINKVDLDSYEKFQHQCPKCSHEWNN